MPGVRTTMNPTEVTYVSDEGADDLRAHGVLLEDTRATTPDGLMDAAVRQVREANYDEATRAGIAEASAKAAEQKQRAAKKASARKSAPAKRSGTSRRSRAAKPDDPPAANGERVVVGDAPSGDVATDTSGDVPADSTTQES